MRDLHQSRAALDYPVGGAAAVISALIRAIEKSHDRDPDPNHSSSSSTSSSSCSSSSTSSKSSSSRSPATSITRIKRGQVILNAHVKRIVVEKGRAVGVELRRGGKQIRARRAVISNASVWDTMRLLPSEGALPAPLVAAKMRTPMTGSFMHLHLGIDATGLPADLESHYSVVNTWDQIDAPQNHVIISIPSVLDPAMAPPGCHVIHAYAAANEVRYS